LGVESARWVFVRTGRPAGGPGWIAAFWPGPPGDERKPAVSGCCKGWGTTRILHPMSSNSDSEGLRDSITIEGLEVECIIGVYDHERVAPQRIIVEATIAVDTQRAAMQDRLEEAVDYEWVAMQIVFILKLSAFRLLETAAHTICRALLLAPVDGESRGTIQSVDLLLRKPDALGGRGVPVLRTLRQVDEVESKKESKAFGSVDVVHETRDVGIYRLSVYPGRRIGLHLHRRMTEAELVLSSGLHCQGGLAARGSVRRWPNGLAHHYENPTDKVQSLLCIDRPPFIEDDEIPIEGAAGVVPAQQVWDI
jgi:dihydroneopterin aldolase